MDHICSICRPDYTLSLTAECIKLDVNDPAIPFDSSSNSDKFTSSSTTDDEYIADIDLFGYRLSYPVIPASTLVTIATHFARFHSSDA
jgi:hypothetical protein